MYDNCSRSKGQGHVTYRVVCMSAHLLDINIRRAERAKLIEIPSRLWIPDFVWEVAVLSEMSQPCIRCWPGFLSGKSCIEW